ncbi:hypothetical protein PS896_05039 [Pseudomonas fluorescens]|jgi:putative transcriptional regulator|uniref:HTH cro/C1-type domain-containing protein n=2 Tax=Pseudomonas TaxID=286 RepID=A0A5E7P4R6_PSEFL|nr:putative transcriptional regulator [Pseudomonas fluorescens]VVP44746.1 hypothetical protein PS896_05039 [Pseudomonas fluorescens]
MATQKIRSKELASLLGITAANLSLLNEWQGQGVKMATLDKLCAALDCQPSDLLEFQKD